MYKNNEYNAKISNPMYRLVSVPAIAINKFSISWKVNKNKIKT